MTTAIRLLATVLVTLGLSAPLALAAGGGNSGYSAPSKSQDYLDAAKLVKSEKFAEAIPLLKKAVEANPKDADAYNLLGFSHRKLGDFDSALVHYQTALKLDPNHVGANEYLGELYLQMGDVEKAEERLSTLNWACLFGCEEYTDLKQAIAEYKAQNGQ